MDLSGDNSGDSVELNDIQLLTVVPPMGIPSHLTVTDPTAILNGAVPIDNETHRPYVVIVEQPQQRGFRFRYECEGPSHGGLQGEKTERSHKTYPSIRIENYNGPARIEVSLVTNENPPRIHAHKLVGKNCEDGVCTMDINSTASVISFPNLCVLHVTRKKAAEVLLHRIMEDLKLNKRLMGANLSGEPSTSAEENLIAKKQAQEQAKNMALNVVHLQFRVFLPNAEGQYLNMLHPVVSQPIYDSKAPGASALKICRMDKYGGCCTGNEEVFLLCEKVQKEDISVRFVEHNKDDSIKWEAYGNFSPLDVHRQYAIVFKTPAYFNANIDKAVNVMIMLQRKSDMEVSEAKAFTYYPQNKDMDLIAKKKRKKLPLDSTFDYYNGDRGPGGGAAGLGGGMGGGFGPPGPGGFGGGGGGSQLQGGYSVIMPNGNIVDHCVLPTTVEQVVKEEFARSSPETTTTDESYLSPQASPFFDPFWGPHLNDLEIDAAPSLRHPSQFVTTAPTSTKSSEVIPELSDPKLKPDGGVSGPSEKGSKETGPKDGEVVKSVAKSPEANSKDRKSKHGKDLGADSADALDGKIPEDSKSDTVHAEQTGADHCKIKITIDSGGATEAIRAPKPRPDNIVAHSETDSGRDERSDIMPSPTRLSDTTLSEGFKTDEGFSEASSIKEDQELKKAGMPEVIIPPKTRSKKGEGDMEEKGSKAVNVATTVIKRIMQKITAKTIRALQDFSETGDPRYLLLVQRHLTAIKNENGDLPIHLAVINNQTTSLQHLLDVMMSLPNARHSINIYNYMRQTALHLAAIMQQPYHIELLLHAGADPSLADRNGNTPAHLAVINNSLEALRSLVKYLRPGVTAANPFPELDYLNYDGYTPVHLAAQSGSVDMLRLLVHGQANVDLADGKSGRTALHHAVELDDLPVAGFLLMEANADVNARCFDGNTPLHVACCRGLIGMVALLMTAGALTDVENEEVPPEEGWEDGEEGEDGWRRCRRGLQPRDYAAGKDRLRILSMLMGDLSGEEEQQTASDPDLGDDPDLAVDPNLGDEESHGTALHAVLGDEGHGHTVDPDLEQDMGGLMTHKSTYDSGLAISLTSHSASSLSGKEKLNYEGHVALSKLLDPECSGKDVFELASRLGYSNLVPALEVMGCTGSSATLYLLDYNESYGSVGKLRECLKAMERNDAVQVLDQHL